MLLLFSLLFKATLSQYTGLLREYCLSDVFNPKCASDEVIVMEHAIYGRMKIGRCVKEDYGRIGCSSDELEYFDILCSGHMECSFPIYNADLIAKVKCLGELSPYLEANYKCLEVYQIRTDKCTTSEKVSANKKSGYLSSVVSRKTSCGSHGMPWILEGQPGQKMNLEILDFAWSNQSGVSMRQRCPVNYGYILDMETDDVINICGGGQREKHLYLSTGHKVQIVLNIDGNNDKNFLIKYKALGCPDYKAPSHTWIEHENESLIIGCHSSDDTWTLRCVDNLWLGVVGMCQPTTPTTSNPLKLTPAVAKSKTKGKKVMNFSDNHVIMFTMGCVTLLICCTVVVVGIYLTKRYDAKLKKLKSNQMIQPTLPSFPQDTLQSQRTLVTYKPVAKKPQNQQDLIDLPPYSFPLAKEERPPAVPHRTSSYRGSMSQSMVTSDYLDPQGDGDSVKYYILENPTESVGSDQMYQSIHMDNTPAGNQITN